jgi:flagellar protein FlgJ
MDAAGQLSVFDPNALGDIKRLARDNSPEGLRAAAKQFEALFLQMVLKSMRDATPQNGLMDNDQTRLFQAMQDQQLAMNMAQGRGIGLADVIFRQFGGEAAAASPATDAPAGLDPLLDLSGMPRRTAITAARPRAAEKPAAEAAVLAAGIAPPASAATARETGAVPDGARAFVNRVWEHAGEASRSTGIPAHFMVAQAALETGWGRAELRRADGTPSHNLFNIKAGSDWKGAVVEVPVKEYANGRAYTENARFRAYGSYEEAFRDYANLLRNSPRYAEVLGQQDGAGFARSLQQAGYATDPMYADKLARIISGSTLRSALEG